MNLVSLQGCSCAQFTSGDVEILVTLDVGPRIISLKLDGQENEFRVKPSDFGTLRGTGYKSYGGHRLWIAPEVPADTYTPDNSQVEIIVDGEVTWFSSLPDHRQLQKSIGIRSLEGGRFEIYHRIRNLGLSAHTIACWAITVMRPGGECLVPQPEYEPHSHETLLPVQNMSLWSYTRLNDCRYELGDHVLRVRQAEDMGPTKLGVSVSQGYGAYANSGHLFLKEFEPKGDLRYPDGDVNFEVFTRQDMLEVETLGPLRRLEPGQETQHTETWTLLATGNPPDDNEECGRWLKRHLEVLGDTKGREY